MNTLAGYCKGEVAEMIPLFHQEKANMISIIWFIFYSEIEQGANLDSSAFPDRISFPFRAVLSFA